MSVIGRQPAPAPLNSADLKGVLTRPVSSLTGVETNVLQLTDSANPGTMLGKVTTKNVGAYNQDINIYTTNQSGANERVNQTLVGANNGRIFFGNEYGIWTETMTTPDGGNQVVQFLSDRLGVWLVAAKLRHYSDLATTMSSVRGLETTTAQTPTTQWSADFGNYYTSQVRVLGSTDWSRWRDNRTVDWVYVVPNNIPWGKFFTSGGSTNMVSGGDNWSNGTRYGFQVSGAYDGFGRWKNPYFVFMRMADGNTTGTLTSSFFSTPTTVLLFNNVADDVKFAVHATAASGGQDAELHQGFGYDDGSNGMKNGYPSAANNMSGGVDVAQSSVWFLLKVADPYTEA